MATTLISPDTFSSTVDSVANFVDRLKHLPAGDALLRTFRGEANKDWRLKPGVMREGQEKLLDRERNAVREIVSVHPDHFSNDQSMFDRLVRMQHFGLPTRLLDMTGNPLVALFNASGEAMDDSGKPADGRVYVLRVPEQFHKYYDSDTVSCVANLCNLSSAEKQELKRNSDLSVEEFNDAKKSPACDRLLQFIRAEKPSFRNIIKGDELKRIWYVVPKKSNKRIIAQNGAFLIFGLETSLNYAIDSIKFTQHKIIIPSNSKKR